MIGKLYFQNFLKESLSLNEHGIFLNCSGIICLLCELNIYTKSLQGCYFLIFSNYFSIENNLKMLKEKLSWKLSMYI